MTQMSTTHQPDVFFFRYCLSVSKKLILYVYTSELHILSVGCKIRFILLFNYLKPISNCPALANDSKITFVVWTV